MRYKVELIEKDIVKISKEFSDYDEAEKYANSLINELTLNSMITVSEKKNIEWKRFRKLSIK